MSNSEEEMEIRELLEEETIFLDDDTYECLLGNCDAFVRLSQGNTRVERVNIEPANFKCPMERWEKVGRAVGNLKGLKVLRIEVCEYDFDEFDDDPQTFNWEILRCIVHRIRNPFHLKLFVVGPHALATLADNALRWAIRGNRFIESFESAQLGAFEHGVAAMDILPALKHAIFIGPSEHDLDWEHWQEYHQVFDQYSRATFEDNQGLHRLMLRSPTLRSVKFSRLRFPSRVSISMCYALEASSPIREVVMHDCFFRAQHAVKILLGLLQNITVETFKFSDNTFDIQGIFQEALLRVLSTNTSLKNLNVTSTSRRSDGTWLGPLFWCMAFSNRTLLSLEVGDLDFSDEQVRTTLAIMLAGNPVLGTLTLFSPEFPTIVDRVHWREIMLSLRTNKTLKSLTIFLGGLEGETEHPTPPLPPLLLIEMIKPLQKSNVLERLVIARPRRDDDDSSVVTVGQSLPVESYLKVLETLTRHTTLKELKLGPAIHFITGLETARVLSLLLPLLRQNYCLGRLDRQVEELGEIGMWLKLNRAGRRYLVEDASTVAQGVAVLAQVSDDLDCLFTHLMENPSLCDLPVDKGEIVQVHRRKRTRVGGGGWW